MSRLKCAMNVYLISSSYQKFNPFFKSSFRVVGHTVHLRLMIVLPNILIGRFILIDEASAPRNSAGLPVIQFFVELYHVLVDLGPLPVNVLILLVQLVAVLVPLVVQLIHCLLVVPVLVCLEVASLGLLRGETVLTTTEVIVANFISATTVKTIDVRSSGSCVLFHDNLIIIVKRFLLLANFVIKLVNLSIDSVHAMVVHVFTHVVVCLV